MGGSDYLVDGSRIGLDGASTITWQGICEALITDWDISDKAIVAATAASASHTPASESFQIRWRNKTDSGSFATLVTGSGELRAGTSAGCITNTDPVGNNCGCHDVALGDTEETENESPLQTASLSANTKDYSVEVQACVDFSNALGGKEYEFELYSVTESVSAGTLTATITTYLELTLPQTNSRIANASASWQGACDADIINWNKTNDFILSTYASGGDGGNKMFKLQWKESGGSFADVGALTTINFNGSTVLVDGNTVANPAECLSSTVSEENEGDNLTDPINMGSSSIVEIQWGLDISLADDATTYEFQLVCITDGTSAVCSCSITTAAGETTAYKDITLKITLESALTYKDVSLKTTLDSLDYKDIILKTSLESALTYKDISLKTTLESVLTYKDITLKTSLISPPSYKDVALKTTLDLLSYKDITLKTTLESIPIYKDITLKTSLNSAPSYKDITLKISFTSATTYKDVSLKTTLDILDYKDINLKITFDSLSYKDVAIKTSLELGEILAYKDIALKTSFTSAITYKDISLKTSLRLPEFTGYKDITLKTSLESATTYKDISLKTTFESALTYKDIALKTSLESIPIYKDIVLKTSLESALTYKDISLKTSLRLEVSIVYKDISLKTSLHSLDYKDISIKVSLEAIPKEIIDFISSITQIENITSSITQTEDLISTIIQTKNFIAKLED